MIGLYIENDFYHELSYANVRILIRTAFRRRPDFYKIGKEHVCLTECLSDRKISVT